MRIEEDRRTDGLMEGQMDGRTDGPMDGPMDGQILLWRCGDVSNKLPKGMKRSAVPLPCYKW